MSSSNNNNTHSLLALLNTTSCHPLLLNMSIQNPSLFREEFSQSSLLYGLCPETYSALGIAIFVLFIYLLTLVLGLVGLIWQRSKPHIQARSLHLILANMIANLTLVLLVSLRVIVSKKYYPCFLLSLTFMLYPPLLTLPSILRGSRLYFLYRLNLKKKKVFGSSSSLDELSEIHSISSMGATGAATGGKFESRKSSSSIHGTTNLAGHQRTNSLNIPQTTIVSSPAASSNDNSSSHWNDFLHVDEKQNNLEDFLSKRDRMLMKLFEFLASYKFFITVYVVSVVIHLSLWAIVGGIELGVYKSTNSWVFVESGFFEASHGCNITPKILIVLGIQAAFYLIWMIVINVLCILSDRDTFNIKLEALILTVILAVILILYTILGSISVITTLVDYFVPYVLIFVIYSWFETVIGVILPVWYSVRSNRTRPHSEKSSNNLVKSILMDKKAMDTISEFARRSYCLEDVLAWKEIQKFKKLRKRKQAAQDFIKTFLIAGSPLELNLPKSAATLANIKEVLDGGSGTDEPPSNLFDTIEFQCVFNMTDLLSRLIVKNEYIAQKIAECNGISGSTSHSVH